MTSANHHLLYSCQHLLAQLWALHSEAPYITMDFSIRETKISGSALYSETPHSPISCMNHFSISETQASYSLTKAVRLTGRPKCTYPYHCGCCGCCGWISWRRSGSGWTNQVGWIPHPLYPAMILSPLPGRGGWRLIQTLSQWKSEPSATDFEAFHKFITAH